jgi:ion channel
MERLRRRERERRERLAPARFGTALLLIVASIFGTAFSDSAGWIRVLSFVCMGAALLFILNQSDIHGSVLLIARVAVVVSVAVAVIGTVVGTEGQPTLSAFIVGALMAFVAPIAIVRRLSHEKVVDLQVLAGALCLYLLIGLFFTFVYKVIDEVHPPMFVQSTQASSTDLTYFSFVTLTTTGYGDFTAAEDGTKMLAVTEALFGQLYLVSAVALVVSRFGSERGARFRPQAPAPDQTTEP